MKLGKTLYVTTREEWRAWLQQHCDTEKEIWLVYAKKHSGKPRIPYNDAVEEALCFGWIDSTVKSIDEDHYAQRFTPRRPGSKLSAMNRERIHRLLEQGRITPAGFKIVKDLVEAAPVDRVEIAPDILEALQADQQTRENFEKFTDSYKRIRIGWIEGARGRPEVFEQRLRYFLKMTAKNKRFGMVQ